MANIINNANWITQTISGSPAFDHTGTVLKITGPGSGAWRINDLPISAGKKYKITLKIKTESAYTLPKAVSPDTSVGINLVATNETHARPGDIILSLTDGGIRSNDWYEVYMGDYIPDEFDSYVCIILGLTATDTSVVSFDEVTMDEVDYVEPTKENVLFNKDDDFNLWSAASQENIYKDSVAPDGSVPSFPKVQITASRGSRESFQLVVQPAAEWTPVTWEWDAFSGPGALAADKLEMRRVLYVTIDPAYSAAPANPYARDGDIPDPLPVEASSTLAQDDCSPFYFTVDIPIGQAIGIYTTSIRLLKDSVLQSTVFVEISVEGTTIPAKPTFISYAGVDPDMIWDYSETGDTDTKTAIINRYSLLLTKRRMLSNQFLNLSNAEVVYADGHLTVEPTAATNARWAYAASLGIDEWPIVITYPGTTLTITSADPLFGSYSGITNHAAVSIFTDDNFTVLTDTFKTLFAEHLIDLKTKLQAQGCNGPYRLHFSGWDEPAIWDNYKFQGFLMIAQYIKQVDPVIQLSYAGRCRPELYKYYDIIYTNQYELFSRRPDAWNRMRIGKAGVYPNNFYGVQIPPIRYRLLIWSLWIEGFRGIEFWGINQWVINPWEVGRTDVPLLIYPSRDSGVAENGPISSVRMEALCDGCQDVELFEQLRIQLSIKDSIASEGDLATAQAAYDAIFDAVSHSPIGFSTPYVQYDHFNTYDIPDIQTIRNNVIEAILLLKGYIITNPQTEGVGNVGTVGGVNNPIVCGVSD